MTETYQKPPLTFQQQLEQLHQRGLCIDDYDYALLQLSTISYYRLSAYWYPFRVRDQHNQLTDQFIVGTSFDDIINLYEFDRHLRLLVMDAIERVEVYIRTMITYHLAHAYGAFGHTDPANFHPKFEYDIWFSKLIEETERAKDAFISHYKNKYEGFPVLPIWIATETISLGNLSFCYKGLKHNDKKQISQKLGLHHKRLITWLHILTYVRNICAHHSRLWNKELAIHSDIVTNKNWSAPITPRTDRIFYVLLMLRHLLKTTSNGDHWQKQCSALIEPIAKKNKWCIAMGLPENWQEHPIWK